MVPTTKTNLNSISRMKFGWLERLRVRDSRKQLRVAPADDLRGSARWDAPRCAHMQCDQYQPPRDHIDCWPRRLTVSRTWWLHAYARCVFLQLGCGWWAILAATSGSLIPQKATFPMLMQAEQGGHLGSANACIRRRAWMQLCKCLMGLYSVVRHEDCAPSEVQLVRPATEH